MKTFKRTCNKLNKILENRPDNRDVFISTINKIIYTEVFQCGGDLYWNRDLFIDCNCDYEMCRKMIDTNKVMFVPTYDMVEHPGITMTYKTDIKHET